MSNRFELTAELIWMDNVYCNGEEEALALCQFDGWKLHDCTTNEAAGVVCKTRLNQTISQTNSQTNAAINSIASSSPGMAKNKSTSADNSTSNALTLSNDAPLLTTTSNTKIRVILFENKSIPDSRYIL